MKYPVFVPFRLTRAIWDGYAGQRPEEKLMVKKPLIIALAALVFFAPQIATAQSQSKAADAAKPAPKLKVGDIAPDFTLKTLTSDGLKDVSLHDYKGKKSVVLAFYVFAFTG